MKHELDCGYHLDQYPWECTCGVYSPDEVAAMREALTRVIDAEDDGEPQ